MSQMHVGMPDLDVWCGKFKSELGHLIFGIQPSVMVCHMARLMLEMTLGQLLRLHSMASRQDKATFDTFPHARR